MTVLRRLFGASREDLWRQLSKDIDGTYIPPTFWRGGKVQADHGEWTITLDSYSNGKLFFTRLRAPYVNPDGFRFTVYERSIFSDIAKHLGMQDVAIGNSKFDDRYIVKGSDERKLKRLFRNARIRDLVTQSPDIHFSVRDDDGWFAKPFPPKTDQLYLEMLGLVKDTERLRLLFDLFGETLDELCRMGSAYEGDAGAEH